YKVAFILTTDREANCSEAVSTRGAPFFVTSARAGFAGERPPAPSARCFALNAAGVKYPRLEWGRTSLWWRRQASMLTSASARFRNHCSDRCWSRNLPLNDSSGPFCHVLPVSMKAVSVYASRAHHDERQPMD